MLVMHNVSKAVRFHGEFPILNTKCIGLKPTNKKEIVQKTLKLYSKP